MSMRRGKFRRLGMWNALPPFNGGKRRLAGVIFGAIDRLIPRATWPSLTFIDGFMGGGSISLFAKAQNFGRVIGIDVALRSVIVGQALLANSRVRLTKDDVVHILAPRQDGPGRVERDLVPNAFTRSQARVIDNALSLAVGTRDEAKAALFRLLAIRIALAAHPFSYVRQGTIRKMTSGEYESITPTALPQYVRGLRLATFPLLWDFAKRINQGVFEGWGEAYQADLLEALPGIEAHILYADPPYAATRSYEAAYKIVDRILGEEARPTSPFTAQGGAQMIDTLLERAKHIPLVVLSFGNETISLQELEQKMVQHGRATRAVEIPYSRLAALSKGEKSGRDRELLVLGWDPQAALLMKASVEKIEVLEPVIEAELGDVTASVQVHSDHVGPEDTAAQRFARERPHEGDARLSQESAPTLTSRSPAEPQAGFDQPDALLIERALGGDAELRRISMDGHYPPSSLEAPMSRRSDEPKS